MTWLKIKYEVEFRKMSIKYCNVNKQGIEYYLHQGFDHLIKVRINKNQIHIFWS